ncbi:hypothetical protein B0H11DRAFT_1942765 [Mycena galericulata]|nr:hypothetical protein B0H11DRAFT_1942765 [Mycena galericulata]
MVTRLTLSPETRGGSRAFAGTIAEPAARRLEDDVLRLGLFTYYNRNGPKVHYANHPSPQTTMLSSFITFYNYALLDAHVGEVRHIIRHQQSGIPAKDDTILAHVAWMKRSNLTPLDNSKFPWDAYPQLGVETWDYDIFADPKDDKFPPIIIPFDQIHCQVARGKISHTDPPLWMTVTMDRFPTSLAAYGFGELVE